MDNHDKVKEVMLLTFDSILQNSPDLIFIKDVNLNYIDASQTFAKIVGYKNAKELIGKSDYDFFDLDLAKRYTEDDRNVLESGIPIIDNVEPLPDQGNRKSFSSTCKFVIRDQRGEAIGLYGIGRDISAQMELEEERECRDLSRQLFEGVLEANITEDRMLRAVGSVWGDELDLLKDGTFVGAVEELASNVIHSDYAAEFRALYDVSKLLSDYEKGIKEFSHITYESSDGSNYKWMEFKSRLYYSSFTNTLRITTFLKDLDDEIRDKEQLKIKAQTDALTGLLNRESIIDQINECINGNGIHNTHALLFIDLDCFKQVNDQYGHPFGDKVLQYVAERLKHLFNKNHIVGRIGGDEFLVFLKNVDSERDVEIIAQEIFHTIPKADHEKDIEVTCSIGVSMYNGSDKRLEQLYREADQAMYRAKENGKNRLFFY